MAGAPQSDLERFKAQQNAVADQSLESTRYFISHNGAALLCEGFLSSTIAHVVGMLYNIHFFSGIW